MSRRRTTTTSRGRRNSSVCVSCDGRGQTALSGIALWSPERGIYRLTGTIPCHRCRPAEHDAAVAADPDLREDR